jgi:hypothetical protein
MSEVVIKIDVHRHGTTGTDMIINNKSDRHIAEILAVLMTTPERDRLDVLAIAVRAAIDSGVVDYRPAMNEKVGQTRG